MSSQDRAQDGVHARPLVLLWLNEAQRYLQAATDAGLTRSLELVTVPAGERPQPELLARAEGVLAYKRSDPQYARILSHIGGIKPGEHKKVPAFC